MPHPDPSLPSSRVSRLKKRFLDVLSGSVKLDSRGATLFLEGLCAQDDPVVCLDVITESAHGLSSVQSAMWSDLSVQFMNGLGPTVLEYLLRASGVGGEALDKLLFHVVEPPIFWGVFVRTFQQRALNEDAQLVFAKVLSRLLTLQDHDTTPYRDLAALPSVQECFLTSSRHELREVGHFIKHILSTSQSVTTCDVLNGPGGRHDNDFVNYRDIAILPTADEILCQKPSFLRTALQDELDSSETPVEVYLDNMFRILREDMIFDIRQEVEVALQKKKGKYRGLRVDDVSMVGIYTGADNRKTSWGIKLQCSSDFRQLKNLKGGDVRESFLKRDPRGSKILRHQSLVCIASGQNVISFGTVNRVEQLLACNPPVIVLQFDSDVNIKKTLTSLLMSQNVRVFQIDSAVFSFEPVLSALKSCSLPLAKEILFWDSESTLESPRNNASLSHIANTLTFNPSAELGSLLGLTETIRLDKAQAKSLVSGLQQRVSLIQGPPGTGKSFIGALLAKALHSECVMLVVCYTNHALDQFLCDLLKYHIPPGSIVRLGGRPNPSTDHLALNKQPRGRHLHNWAEIDVLKTTASRHEGKLQSHISTLLDKEDKRLMTHLEVNHYEFYTAFYVSFEMDDGMERVGRNGQTIDSKYLISRWMQGLNAGVLSGEPQVQASARIWAMERSARQQLLDEWRQEILAQELDSICADGRQYNDLQDAIKRQFAQPTASILCGKRIIACTTTGAAMYSDVLKQVGIKALLVEEAGEILESHIVTALSSEVDRMILIGDHKQLRPKVNNYQLTVERGEGHDLNRSLFERLILKGYPHETLSTQHRMRPEISAFVRELTYPELVDSPSTYRRSDIRGVQSNVIFINHAYPEDDDALISDRADGGAKASKQNTYEVQMVLKIVRYLAQQGYKGEDVVILTPYLGQLHLLRDALKKDNDPIINDMDSSELARAGLSPLATSDHKAKRTRIHLATIDNYQGEESNIVVASLTRSNKSGAIGFMDSPERLNVLLSRARDGLILIGNSQTFLHSRKGGLLWKKFFTLAEKGEYFYQGFPVKCERHPERKLLLKSAGDFDNHFPDGGCTDLCGFTLACGHVCSLKCHPRRSSSLSDPHDASQCKVKMNEYCQAGQHKITWECRLGRPTSCGACVKEEKRLAEIARQTLEVQRKREEAEAEHRRQLAEMEEKVRAERAAEEARRLSEERRRCALEERKRREEEARKIREAEEEAKRMREEDERRRYQEAVERRRRQMAEVQEAARVRLEAERRGRLERQQEHERALADAKKKKAESGSSCTIQ